MKKEMNENLNSLVEDWGFDNVIHGLYTGTKKGQELFVEYMFGWEMDDEYMLLETDLGKESFEVYKTLPIETKFYILDELDCIDVDRLVRCREDHDYPYHEIIDNNYDTDFESEFIDLMKPYVREMRLEGLGL